MEFDAWLSERLLELKTDESVFGPYIKSIVEGDEDMEDKVEALDGILEGLGDASLDVEKLRLEILAKWDAYVKASSKKEGGGDVGEAAGQLSKEEEAAAHKLSLDTQLEQLLRLSPEQLTGSSKGSKDAGEGPDSALRAAILKQCQEVDSDDEGDGDGHGASGGGGGLSGLYKNTNAERVLGEQKEMKERAKEEAAKKRERDKEDRARQKKAAEERKDKAKKKATKVERKR